MKSPKVLLVTGGSRSGKTAYALQRAMEYERRIYLATAEPVDSEMEDRITRHQQERGGDFTTMEEPIDLSGALRRVPEDAEVVLVDCMTVWLGNLMHHQGVQADPYDAVNQFLAALKKPPCNLIIVTNEVGSGIIPHDPMTRTYRDHAGWLNQDIAKIAAEVVLVACGLPLVLKECR
ncbi:MAG: bifunctional adenosylcobinamide kinase/adenosylcobinamide-phosphate guanylyltransferase [Verrucomicrobiota bacterium]